MGDVWVGQPPHLNPSGANIFFGAFGAKGEGWKAILTLAKCYFFHIIDLLKDVRNFFFIFCLGVTMPTFPCTPTPLRTAPTLMPEKEEFYLLFCPNPTKK